MKIQTLVLGGLAVVDAGRLSHRRPNRLAELSRRRLKLYLRGVGSAKANCGDFHQAQYDALEPYLIEENGRKSYYSNVGDAGNKIGASSLASISTSSSNEQLTFGNGWCDKNVYASWNKCAVSGKCYKTCEDGNCYAEVANSGAEIPVPDGCNKWMLECADQCTNDAKCVAWSFKNTNVLGNAEYTCNLMSEVLCTRSEQDYGDPRSVYHVKNEHIQQLFDDYDVTTVSGLEATKFTNEFDHMLNYWTSWGYHICHTNQPNGEKCGQGFVKRQRTSLTGQVTIEKRTCDFKLANGTDVVCEQTIEREDDIVFGHGWMNWGAWSPCSQSCGSNGVKKRSRRCGTCPNPDNDGRCEQPGEALHQLIDDSNKHCPVFAADEIETCTQAKCLPWSNGKGGNEKYVVRNGWSTHQTNVANTEADYLGGCVDFTVDSVKVKVPIMSIKNAFVHCMKECADLGDNCLSITYFPRLQKPYWVNFYSGDDFNCFLHQRRCHESGQYRDQDYLSTQPALDDLPNDQLQSSAPSWYAYKDLCSNTMICDRWGSAASPFYTAICDSTGPNAFPADPQCSCPFSKDKKSAVRAWGNAVGWNYYNHEKKRVLNRKRNQSVTQRALFYTEKKYYNGVPNFMEAIPNGQLPCHDPCAHNECSTKSKCQFNPDSPIGYDCLCQWPSVRDESRFGESGQSYAGFAGLEGQNGCIAAEFRNPSSAADNDIMFGGGWNTLKDAGQSKPIKPHTAYYALKSTSDPWTFEVAEATRIPPTSPNSPKGRFYNCIVNLAPNKMMVVAGKSGQFFDTFDDKTMVYEWDSSLSNGKWVGVNGEDQSGPCLGDKDESNAQHGCTRLGEWPDYPHTPVTECQGQCRNGTVGSGPTSIHWLNQYCTVRGEFYDSEVQQWVNREFQLCPNKIVRDDSNGEQIDGLAGKWIVTTNDVDSERAAYNKAVMATMPFYGSEQLKSLDAEHHPNNLNTRKDKNGERRLSYWRWKSGKTLPTSLYTPFLGLVSGYQRVQSGNLKVNRNGRTYHGMGQPLCGLVGDRVMTGSGAIGRIFSLSKTAETVDKEKVWKMEPKSEFPLLRRKTDGTECRAYEQFKEINGAKQPIKFRPIDARRQNFGTVVTTEGLWMIGGLLEPAADLPYRARSDMMNVEGCTKRAHLQDVWVFNPKGWSREQVLGDAVNKYRNKNDAQILPTITGYPFSTDTVEVDNLPQQFDSFRLYDDASDGVTIDQAIEEGWECTGVDGNWCRKPFLNRYTKASGQSGPKQTKDGAGFRPEIDYLEVRRADGTFGSDRAFYRDQLAEHCPNAETTYPTVDAPIEHDNESAVSDATQCTDQCGQKSSQPECNRLWAKRNLRRRWHEAGRIKHGRMGSLSGVLKGELLLWGGECYGDSTVRDFGPDGLLRAAANVKKPRPCRMITEKSGKRKMGDYIEAFSFVRMNRAGFLFGERRQVDLIGFPVGSASHDESATSQAYSAMNTFHLN